MPLAAFPKCYLDDLSVHHTMSVYEWVDLASTLDIDGLEFYWGFTPYEDLEALLRIRRYIESKQLRMPMMCYSPDFIKPIAGERLVEVKRARQAIEATAILGGQYCRVLSGQRREDVTRCDGIKMVADSIAELVPHAEKHDVVLILENHYKDGYWQYPEFAQKMDLFLELLAAIPDSPWFGVNYDPSNALIAGDDPLALLDAVKQRVVTMHASDRYFEGGSLSDLRNLDQHPQQGYAPMLKHGVIGRGMNNYDAIFSKLSNAGFKGWISIEDGQDPTVGMEHLRLSAEFLRAKMKEHGLP